MYRNCSYYWAHLHMFAFHYSDVSTCMFKDVCAHWYCASLVRVPRHVFQARAPSQNLTKDIAGDLGGNLICEYFCWMLGDPHFFFRQITSFSDCFHYTKKQKKLCTWEVLIISHILFK